MLRIYLLQNWYALSDPMAEETLFDSEATRRFAGIELGDDRFPDETMVLNFRHLLERHGMTEAIFAYVNAHLADKDITLRSGMLVDATTIDRPSSTKSQAKARYLTRTLTAIVNGHRQSQTGELLPWHHAQTV